MSSPDRVSLLVATTNPGKLAEVSAILKDLSVHIIPLSSLDNPPIVREDGKTFEENALKKGRIFADFSECLTLADDSGLVVDALGGAPGVLSARYSGPSATDKRNNQKLLQDLSGVSQMERAARFVCVLALCAPSTGGEKRREWLFRGECEGWIAFSPCGENGFGYDPLFFYPPLNKTFGQLDRETKCRISHRGKALQELKRAWNSLLPGGTSP